jgi:hypothetical protein
MGAVHLERGPNVAILRSGCVRTVRSGAGGVGQTHLWGPGGSRAGSTWC